MQWRTIHICMGAALLLSQVALPAQATSKQQPVKNRETAGAGHGPLDDSSDLQFSTFLGGAGFDEARAVAVGPDGSVYVTGDTGSDPFPTTPGAYDTTFHGVTDVFVTRLRAGRVVYSTLLGGSPLDEGLAIAVGPDGSAYVTGETNSMDFPVTPGAFDTTYNGQNGFSQDTFVARLDPTGSSLVYSSFLGGTSYFGEYGAAIAVDAQGLAYVAGVTQSSDFPTTPGAYSTTYIGSLGDYGGEAYLTKFDPTGGSLVYSTYLGGSGGTAAFGIALAPDGSAYLTGSTGSPDFPTTPGAYDTTCGTDGQCNPDPQFLFLPTDAFASHLSADGSRLLYSTFLGGSTIDSARSITVSPMGAFTVMGSTLSADFPTTPDAYDTTCGTDGQCNPVQFVGPQTDVFVTRFVPTGESLLYSTFLGGSGGECTLGCAMTLGPSGAVLLTGDTSSADFPTTRGAFDVALAGGDAFVVELSPDGRSLVYGTFLGGGISDYGYAIASAGPGTVYVAGNSFSGDFPTTPGAPERQFAGVSDGYVTRLHLDPRCNGGPLAPPPGAAQPEGPSSMHVAALAADARPTGQGYEIGVAVGIADPNNQPVISATVQLLIALPNCRNVTRSLRTDAQGQAAGSFFTPASGTYRISVATVTRRGYYYDASQNVRSQVEVTIP